MTTRRRAGAAATPQAIIVRQLKRKVDITPEFILRCNLSTNYFSSQYRRHPNKNTLVNLSSNIMMVYLWVSCKFNLLHFRNLDFSTQFLPPNHVIGSRARFEFQGLEPSFMNKAGPASLRSREDSQRKKFFDKFRWERRPSDKHREFIDQLQFPKGNK